jgi:hypothetical protein
MNSVSRSKVISFSSAGRSSSGGSGSTLEEVIIDGAGFLLTNTTKKNIIMTGAGATYTLPFTPVTGTRFNFTSNTGADAGQVIDGNGHNINIGGGPVPTYTFLNDGNTVSLIYDGIEWVNQTQLY